MATCVLAFGAAQLQLDGMLIVKGLPLDGSQVIVVTKDGEDQVITEGLSHFTLNLELQKDYLVSFERPGCVSKQLRFNTHVADGYLNQEGFRFPFQVTLEPAPVGEHMEYAGPVGYIHFDEKLKDFSYSTDYRILKDAFLAKELEVVQTKLKSNVMAAPSIMAAPAKVERPVESTRSPSPIEAIKPVQRGEVIAPVVSRTAPMVHVLATPVVPSPPPAHSPAPVSASAVIHGPQVSHAPEPAEVPAQVTEYKSVDDISGVEKEVQVDSLRVVTIIRFHKGANTDEYRRVVSYYGGTTYFCNGYACSADTFQREVNR